MKQYRYYTARPVRLLKEKQSVALLRRGQDFAIDRQRNVLYMGRETYRCTKLAIEKLVQLSRYSSEPPAPLDAKLGVLPPRMVTAIRGSRRVPMPRRPLPFYQKLFQREADVLALMKKLFTPFRPTRYRVGSHNGYSFQVSIKLKGHTVDVDAFVFMLDGRPGCSLMFVAKSDSHLDLLPTSKSATDAYRLFGAFVTTLSKKFDLKPFPAEISRALVHTNVHQGRLLSYSVTF